MFSRDACKARGEGGDNRVSSTAFEKARGGCVSVSLYSSIIEGKGVRVIVVVVVDMMVIGVIINIFFFFS